MPNFDPQSEEQYSSLFCEKQPRYVRIPYEVGVDERLSAYDVRVYFAIASCVWQGKTATMGNERIANITSMTARQVRLSVKNLALCGHIRVAERKRGERGVYMVTSAVFGKKQGKVDEVASMPRGGKRLVSVSRKTG